MARGRRSEESKKSSKRKWLDKGGYAKAKLRLEAITEVKQLEKYPSEFVRIPTNGAIVQERIKISFPGVVPQELPSASATGRLLFPTPATETPLHSHHPPYMAMRFDKVVRKAVRKKLLASWDRLLTFGVVFPPADPNRSSTPALHLGTWELSQSKPYITADTRKQPDQVICEIDRFLQVLGEDVAPRLAKLLAEFCPVQLARQLKSYTRVSNILRREYALRPCLDFKGAFFTAAVKEGSSERIHIDFNDDCNGITWVIPLGDWEGGEFCSVQLKQKIPICAGQAFGFTARTLAHCNKILLAHGDAYKEKVIR